MERIISTRIGSLHMRNRVHLKRYGVTKGELCYMVHIGRRSFYYYPAWCKRPIKPHFTFT